MYSENFDYYRPDTVQEALTLLKGVEGAKLLAGGHSLLPAMKLRVAAPKALVDIRRLHELEGISVSDGRLSIGALTTHDTVATSQQVNTNAPLLAETAAMIGDQQVRNMGTIGGSLAHADPGADYPTAFLALDGTVTVAGAQGVRQIPASEFFVDLMTTTLRSDDLITSVQVPVSGENSGSAYIKHPHPASGYAVVGVAAFVRSSAGRCEDVRLVVGGVTAIPTRCTQAEQVLKGATINAEVIASAADLVRTAITDPLADVYASAEYRTHLATVLARRALDTALSRT